MDERLERQLRQLIDEQEIRAVLYRRARATDQRDLEVVLSCYQEGAREDHEGFEGPLEQYLRTVSPVFVEDSPVEVCSHLIGNVEIEIDGDGAQSECYFICCLTAREGGVRRDFINAGRYIDDLERRHGRWAITRRRCVDDWSRGDDVSEPWWDRSRVSNE